MTIHARLSVLPVAALGLLGPELWKWVACHHSATQSAAPGPYPEAHLEEWRQGEDPIGHAQ